MNEQVRQAAERRCSGGSVGFTNGSVLPASVIELQKDARLLADELLSMIADSSESATSLHPQTLTAAANEILCAWRNRPVGSVPTTLDIAAKWLADMFAAAHGSPEAGLRRDDQMDEDTEHYIACELTHDIRNMESEEVGLDRVRWNNRAMMLAINTIAIMRRQIAQTNTHEYRPFTTRDGSIACSQCYAPSDHPCHIK